MGKKVYIYVFFIIIIGLSITFKLCSNSIVKPGSQERTVSLPFLIGAYDNGNEQNRRILTDSLGMNLWHKFLRETIYESQDGRNYYHPVGWSSEDNIFNQKNERTDNVAENILNLNGEKLRTLMQRPITEWLFFSQRSDYQCEDESSLIIPDYNWFYTYKFHERGRDIRDKSKFGNGNVVRYCDASDYRTGNIGADSGYVVRGLKSNREQVNTGNPGHGYPYPGYGDGQFSWYIKPRIRIDSTFASKQSNWDIKVCRIEVLDYDGNDILKQDLSIKNFIDIHTGVYDGSYADTFNSYSDSPVDLKIDKGWLFNPKNKNWLRYSNDNCKVDFRVFWYGKCNMWIDYIRVEDQRAFDLFGDTLTNPVSKLYMDMIKKEVQISGLSNSPLMFYIDEFEFNHIPAISFVMNRIKEFAGTGNPPYCLAVNTLNDFYNNHLSSGWLNWDHFRRYMLDSCNVKLFGLSNSYPFTGSKDDKGNYISCLPETLPETTSPYCLAKIVRPDDYEAWLQDWIKTDKSNFRAFCEEISYLGRTGTGSNTFCSIQTHAHISEDCLREPTNEEISMNVNMAISYGIQGIVYYDYNSFGIKADGTFGMNFGVGLINRDVSGNLYPRYFNFYGEEKWNCIKHLNSVLKIWAPYIMDFDRDMTQTFVYDDADSRKLMQYNSFVNDVRTYLPDNLLSAIPSSEFDKKDRTYSQVSTFSSHDGSRFFMFVNRRCSPHRHNVGIAGGLRYVKVKIDASNKIFEGSKKWKIINVCSDNDIREITSGYSGFIDLGWIEPGEGKLYKIIPFN